MMEIRIDSHRLVSILIKAGIEAPSAKSLVFDILSEQNGVVLTDEQETRTLVKRPVDKTKQQQQQLQQQNVNNDEEENEDDSTTNITKVKHSGSTMDFSRFGGNFNGINKR